MPIPATKHRNVKELTRGYHILCKLNVRLAREKFPDGWLCARITAHAFPFNAATKIDLGSETVPVAVPEETS